MWSLVSFNIRFIWPGGCLHRSWGWSYETSRNTKKGRLVSTPLDQLWCCVYALSTRAIYLRHTQEASQSRKTPEIVRFWSVWAGSGPMSEHFPASVSKIETNCSRANSSHIANILLIVIVTIRKDSVCNVYKLEGGWQYAVR